MIKIGSLYKIRHPSNSLLQRERFVVTKVDNLSVYYRNVELSGTGTSLRCNTFNAFFVKAEVEND